MPAITTFRRPHRWRQLSQLLFLAWTAWAGIQFGLFVRHFETAGTTPLYLRPPSIEAFLPIGALVSLKHWLASGNIHPVHPAALVLFLTFVGMSVLAKKSFCSWLCPVGTLSDWAWKAGRGLLGRNFLPWKPLDLMLRSLKYLLLLFFVKLILIDMPAAALGGFLDAPYWAISDVKMLHFFTGPSTTTLVVVGALLLASLAIKNAWCRYLCPYGALLGLASLLSPFKIRRQAAACNGCKRCSRACPASLPVDQKSVIRSAECTGCLSCISQCRSDALAMTPPGRRWPQFAFPLTVLGLFAIGVLSGMLSGHWQTNLDYADYLRLIPLASRLGH